MVSQHDPSPNKAAAILRASLNRRTDPQSGTPILPGSRHGPSAGSSNTNSSSRRESGRPPVGPPSDLRVAVGDDAVEVGQESLALTDSIHGPDSLHGPSSRSRLNSTSSRNSLGGGSTGGGRPSSRNSVHDGHGDIESALPFTSVNSTVGAKSSKLGRKLSAASLVRQVSQGSIGGSGRGSLSDVDLHTVSSGRTDGRDLVLVGNVNLAPPRRRPPRLWRRPRWHPGAR